MRRREFIAALGGAAAWPLAARAQQSERMRRIGVLIQVAEGDLQARVEVAAFLRELQKLGWSDGHNLRVDIRWGDGEPDRIRKYAAELIALAPEVVLGTGGTVVGACSRRAIRCQSCSFRLDRHQLCRKAKQTVRLSHAHGRLGEL